MNWRVKQDDVNMIKKCNSGRVVKFFVKLNIQFISGKKSRLIAPNSLTVFIKKEKFQNTEKPLHAAARLFVRVVFCDLSLNPSDVFLSSDT